MGDAFVTSTAVEDDKSSEISFEGSLTQKAVEILKEGHGVQFINRFTLKLLHAMLENEKNFVVNPLIALCSVAAVTLGANKSSLDELSKGLMNITFQDENEEEALMSKIKSCREETLTLEYLKTPSYIYVYDDFKMCNKFKEFCDHYFGVSARQTRFDERDLINLNERIKYDTDGNLGSTIKELGEGIKMLAIDCTYFCGLWKQGFSQTKPSTFTNYNDTSSEVDFMHAYGNFKNGFNNKLQCHIIELPYNTENAKMVILMPEKGVDFQTFLAASSNGVQLLEIINSSRLKYEQSEIWLPKFRSEFIISMKGFYRQLGIQEIFDISKADFSRLVDSKEANSHNGLFLGDIIQKVVFEVKQQGSQTLKITDVVDATNVFKCNRPFLFFVLVNYKRTQLILFQGAVKLL